MPGPVPPPIMPGPVPPLIIPPPGPIPWARVRLEAVVPIARARPVAIASLRSFMSFSCERERSGFAAGIGERPVGRHRELLQDRWGAAEESGTQALCQQIERWAGKRGSGTGQADGDGDGRRCHRGNRAMARSAIDIQALRAQQELCGMFPAVAVLAVWRRCWRVCLRKAFGDGVWGCRRWMRHCLKAEHHGHRQQQQAEKPAAAPPATGDAVL